MYKLALALAALVLCTGAQAAQRHLVITDSIFSQAYGSVRTSKMAFNIVNAKTNAVVSVLGSPGATVTPLPSSPGAASLLDAIEYWKGLAGGDWVFIQVSTNDHGLSAPLASYKNSLRLLVGGIQDKNLLPICLTPMWKSTQNVVNSQGLKLIHYQQAMREVCDEYGTITLTYNADTTDFVDGIHLNEAGHAKYAEWFINAGAYLGGWTRTVAATSFKTKRSNK